MRHQFATVHELARIELLAGLPGETLGRLAERMRRRELRPGDAVFEGEDERGAFAVVLAGMLTGGGRLLRPGDAVEEPTFRGEPLRAMTPAAVATCDRETFEELLRPVLGGSS